jgi:preprotein translocase subunit SecB
MSEEQQAPVFQIQRVYLKGMSLEQPDTPTIVNPDEDVRLEVSFSTKVNQISEDFWEVTVTFTVQPKAKDKTIFLVEISQAGIFEISNLSDQNMGQLLHITCPEIIFSYLRSNMGDVILRAGHTPVHLPNVDFQAMYEQQQAANQ